MHRFLFNRLLSADEVNGKTGLQGYNEEMLNPAIHVRKPTVKTRKSVCFFVCGVLVGGFLIWNIGILLFCVGFCRVFVDIMFGDLDIRFCGEFQVGEYHRNTPELGFLSFWNEKVFASQSPWKKNHWDRNPFCKKSIAPQFSDKKRHQGIRFPRWWAEIFGVMGELA